MTDTTETSTTTDLFIDLVEARSKDRHIDSPTFGDDYVDYLNNAKIPEFLDAGAVERLSDLLNKIAPGRSSWTLCRGRTWEREAAVFEAVQTRADEFAGISTRNEEDARKLEKCVLSAHQDRAFLFVNLFIEPFANHVRHSGRDIDTVIAQLRERANHKPAA